MKNNNLIITVTEESGNKKTSIAGKIYFWERVEAEIVGSGIVDHTRVRAAIYDDNTQVCVATNFQRKDDNTISCDFLLRTQSLQGSLSGVSPGGAKQLKLYLWDEIEEQIVFIANLPISQNPYIQNELSSEIIVSANIMIQYSVDGIVWTDEANNLTRYIRFSVDGGTSWNNAICVGTQETDDSSSESSSDEEILSSNIIEISRTITESSSNTISINGYVIGVEMYSSASSTTTEKAYPGISYDSGINVSYIFINQETIDSVSQYPDGKNIIKIQYFK